MNVATADNRVHSCQILLPTELILPVIRVCALITSRSTITISLHTNISLSCASTRDCK
jgi:hypothetical protein